MPLQWSEDVRCSVFCTCMLYARFVLCSILVFGSAFVVCYPRFFEYLIVSFHVRSCVVFSTLANPSVTVNSGVIHAHIKPGSCSFTPVFAQRGSVLQVIVIAHGQQEQKLHPSMYCVHGCARAAWPKGQPTRFDAAVRNNELHLQQSA